MSDPWLTATAVVAVIVFLGKSMIGGIMELQRRKHLRKALKSFVDQASDKYNAAVENLDEDKKDEVEQKITDTAGGEEGYTPYILYDSLVGFSVNDIRRDYGFLEGDLMDATIRYITAENYLHSICAELRTEYVRKFSQDRKIGIFHQYITALENARKASNSLKEKLN